MNKLFGHGDRNKRKKRNKHPHIIVSPNVSDSILVKINGTIVKKWKHLTQISIRDLHNDIILPIYQGVFLVQELWMNKYLLDIRLLVIICQNI